MVQTRRGRGRPRNRPPSEPNVGDEVPLDKPEEAALQDRKQPPSEPNVGDEVPLYKPEEAFDDTEVKRQSAAVRAFRAAQIDGLVTLIRLLRTEFDEEQSKVPVSQFFKENFQDLCILETGADGQYEVRFKEKDGNLSISNVDHNALHNSLLLRLSSAYLDGFTCSAKSVKNGAFGADKLQIRSLGALEEPSDSQAFVLKEGLQTPDVNNSRLSVGMTPKSRRVPKHGEILLSVHGSPLGVYKEDNMETIEEIEDMIG